MRVPAPSGERSGHRGSRRGHTDLFGPRRKHDGYSRRPADHGTGRPGHAAGHDHRSLGRARHHPDGRRQVNTPSGLHPRRHLTVGTQHRGSHQDPHHHHEGQHHRTDPQRTARGRRHRHPVERIAVAAVRPVIGWRTCRGAPRRRGRPAGQVVDCPQVRVSQDPPGLVHLGHPVSGPCPIRRVDHPIRVKPAGQHPIGVTHHLRGGIGRHSERAVGVDGAGHPSTLRSPPDPGLGRLTSTR